VVDVVEVETPVPLGEVLERAGRLTDRTSVSVHSTVSYEIHKEPKGTSIDLGGLSLVYLASDSRVYGASDEHSGIYARNHAKQSRVLIGPCPGPSWRGDAIRSLRPSPWH
jgi:hypothetical protein